MNKRAFLIFMRSVSKFARFLVAMYFFHAYESSCFENGSVGHYIYFSSVPALETLNISTRLRESFWEFRRDDFISGRAHTYPP